MSNTTAAPATITLKVGRTGGTAADNFQYRDEFAQVQVGDFLSELLVTDTVVYEVIKVTKASITVRNTVTTGGSHKDEACDEGAHGLSVQWEEVASWHNGPTQTYRLRKDGSIRSGSHAGARPFRPAQKINGVPVRRVDHRF